MNKYSQIHFKPLLKNLKDCSTANARGPFYFGGDKGVTSPMVRKVDLGLAMGSARAFIGL
jgi:hypothetical protein